jgi:hypothetical protein
MKQYGLLLFLTFNLYILKTLKNGSGFNDFLDPDPYPDLAKMLDLYPD